MNRKKFINEIAGEVRAKIESHLVEYNRNLYYEKEYNGGLIVVSIYVERICNGYYLQNTEVDIQHDNSDHRSPLLTEAIKRAMPNWLDIEEEIFDEQRQSA